MYWVISMSQEEHLRETNTGLPYVPASMLGSLALAKDHKIHGSELEGWREECPDLVHFIINDSYGTYEGLPPDFKDGFMVGARHMYQILTAAYNWREALEAQVVNKDAESS